MSFKVFAVHSLDVVVFDMQVLIEYICSQASEPWICVSVTGPGVNYFNPA